MRPDLVAHSKLLSYVLRHAPQAFGITLEEGGWVAVDTLLAALAAGGHVIDRDLLDEVVHSSDKKRFTFDEERRRIRAAQGHSIEVDLALEPAAPPPVLYHGTSEARIEAILREGLRPMRRQHVHLSADVPTAIAVGRRHGRPRVLRVDTHALAAAGQPFWRADNGVWLTQAVSARYLAIVEAEPS